MEDDDYKKKWYKLKNLHRLNLGENPTNILHIQNDSELNAKIFKRRIGISL
jgi:hypothetical protein